METRPSAAELFGASEAFVELLIAHLDEKGVIDGEALAALYMSMATHNQHSRQRTAMLMVGQRVSEAVQRMRLRKRGPTPPQH